MILSYMTLKQLATGYQGRKTVYRLVKFGYFQGPDWLRHQITHGATFDTHLKLYR